MYKFRNFLSVRIASTGLIFFAIACFFSMDSFAKDPDIPASTAITNAPAASTPTTSAPTTSTPITSAPTTSTPTTSTTTTSAPIKIVPKISAPTTSTPIPITPSTKANPVTASPKNPDPLLFDASVSIGNPKKKYYKACSIYIYIRSLFKVDIVNMSTFNVSSCPASEFGNVTAASVIAQLRSVVPITLVSMVGPYYQMMDENDSVIESSYISIGNLNFSPVMRAQISVLNIFNSGFRQLNRWANGDANYNPIATVRNAQFIWYKGSTIYRLIDPEGNQYVLIYFAPLDIDSLSSEEEVTTKLAQLPNVLSLPHGWAFEKKVLKRILTHSQIPFQGATGALLKDDLNNLYVKVDDDLN